MKIGLVTFYTADNYGTCLQAFALQKVMEQMGYNVEIIQYNEKKKSHISKRNLFERIRSLMNAYPGLLLFSYPRVIKKNHEKKEKFTLFRKQNLKFSVCQYTDFETLKAANAKYNAFVCGSDMIWSDIGQNRDFYFLKFVDKYKRISYAPSLAAPFEKDEHYYYLKEALEGIRFLSCREESGLAYVKWATGRDALLTLDPTILLVDEEWKNIFNIQEYKGHSYILCYLFEGISDVLLKKIKKLAKANKLEIRFIPIHPREYLWESRNGSAVYDPKKFVELFANASFIVTNSYHGLIFSLIFKKPFIVIQRQEENAWKPFELRMRDILDICDQRRRLLDQRENITADFLKLDYNFIDSKIDFLRMTSHAYLESALATVVKEANRLIVDI